MEDRVVGPLTLRQFGYILGAGGFSFIIWTFLPIKVLAIILIIIVSSLFLALAFAKINNRPFGDILESAFAYYTGNKVYTWKQPKPEDEKPAAIVDKKAEEEAFLASIPKGNSDKLHEIALGLDVLDRQQESASYEMDGAEK